MDCPICLKENIKRSSSSTVTLECGHAFCRPCISSWFLKQVWNFKCPMCRQSSIYFSRNTRSKKMADLVLTATMELLVLSISIDGNAIDIRDILAILRVSYEPFTPLWQRPKMIGIRKLLGNCIPLQNVMGRLSLDDLRLLAEFFVRMT